MLSRTPRSDDTDSPPTRQDVADRNLARGSIIQLVIGTAATAFGVWIAKHPGAVRFNFDVAIWGAMLASVLVGLILQLRAFGRGKSNVNVLRGHFGLTATVALALATKMVGETASIVLSIGSIVAAAVAVFFFARGYAELRRDIAD